jgi:hypothetical protein
VVDELVARGAALGVDVAGGDLERRLGERERLHLREMRREHHAGTAFEKVGQHAGRERGAFDRIGPGAGLVEDDEAARSRLVSDRCEVGCMRGERREIALDRLRIANVGEDGAEARQARAVRGMDEEPRLREQRREPERLEGDRLPAGVRTGDRQAVLVVAKRQVDRHDVAMRELEERMANRAQDDIGRAEHRSRGAMDACELRGGGVRIDARQRRLERRERVGVRAHEVGELDANAPLLGLFRLGGQQETVVELDGEQRLDEDGLVGAGAVLHDAPERPCGRRPDRHDVTTVPHRDVLVRDDVGMRRIAHDADQPLLELGAQLSARRARRRQRRARLLAHLATLVERACERRAQIAQVDERVGESCECRKAVGCAA